MILGYNSNEGLMPLADCHKNKKYELYDRDLASRIPRSIALDVDDPRNAELAEEIRKFYFEGQKISNKMKFPMAQLLGDFHFVIELHLVAEIYARCQRKWARHKLHLKSTVPWWPFFIAIGSCSIYFYKLDCEEDVNIYKKILHPDIEIDEDEIKTFAGGSHGDDIYFLFE